MRRVLGGFSAAALVALVAGSAAAQAGSAAPKRGEWRTLFDGKTASAWRGYKMDTMPSGWTVVDGVLGKTKTTSDIITREQFADFEFEMDWKLEKGGNAGLFYRGSEEFDRVYWSAPEYQLLDDLNARDGMSRLTSAGAAYGLYPSAAGIVKPGGEWNSTRIVVKGAHVEHWLNGTKLLEYELWSPDWEAKVQASKFKAWTKYGRAKRGHIAIQGDHNGALLLRNLRVREL